MVATVQEEQHRNGRLGVPEFRSPVSVNLLPKLNCRSLYESRDFFIRFLQLHWYLPLAAANRWVKTGVGVSLCNAVEHPKSLKTCTQNRQAWATTTRAMA